VLDYSRERPIARGALQAVLRPVSRPVLRPVLRLRDEICGT
jgi:hypothetical protein